MNRQLLLAKLVSRGKAAHQDCVKLSATRYIPVDEWVQLQRHEKQFLRCWAVGAATYTSVLVGRAAAVVQGMWVVPTEFKIELANPKGTVPRKAQCPDGIGFRRMTVPEMDIRTIGANSEVKLTTKIRTAVDIARWHGVREGVVAMDSLFVGQPWMLKDQIRDELEKTITRLSGKRGIENARTAFALSSILSESPFESLVRLLLRQQGLQVEEQMRIGRYRVDLLWGQLIIEIDGNIKYDEDPKRAAMAQLQRESDLNEMGYRVIRIKPSQLLASPSNVLERIYAAKRQSERLGPVTTEAVPAW